MLSRVIKSVIGLLATAIALLLIAGAAIGMWVMTGPKTLSKITPYIESALNDEKAPYRVKVDNSVLTWESWLMPIDFRLRGVALTTPEGENLLRLNEISLKLDIPSLLRLKIVPYSVSLHKPQMNIFTDENGEFYIGFGGEDHKGLPLKMLFASLGDSSDDNIDNSLIGSIQKIAIRHGRLTLGNAQDGAMFTAPDANLIITRRGRELKAVFKMAMASEEGISDLHIDATLKQEQEMLAAQATLKRFSPHLLARLFPRQPEWQALNMPLDGNAAISIDAAGNVTTLDFKVEGNKGVFSYPQDFAEDIAIDHALVEGQFRNNLSQLLLNQAMLDFGDTTLSLNGFATHGEDGWSYDALAVAENMPVNDLYKYWPKTLAPVPYEWVTKHIREGVVPRAEAKISVGNDAEEVLDTTIQVEGASVEYLDGHPKVEDVAATVKFVGKSMEITSQHGKMLTGGVLNDAWLSIPDLMAEKPEMHIKLVVNAPAADVATYLMVPDLDYAAPLGLNPETISGTVAGNLQFDFFLPDSEKPEQDIELTFLIETDITDAAQPGFMAEGDLTGVNGKLKITQDELTFEGAMTMNGAPLHVVLTHDLHEKTDYPTIYKASGEIPTSQLTAFGLPQMEGLEGMIGLSAEIKRNRQDSNTKAVIEAGAAGLQLPQIGFSKVVGVPLRVQFEALKKGEDLQVKSFKADGKDIAVEGTLAVRQNFGLLERLTLNKALFGQNNFSGSAYREEEGSYTVRAKGYSIDLTPYMEADSSKTAEAKAAETGDLPFALDVQAEFGALILGEKRRLYGVNARLECGVKMCESADIRGSTDKEAPEQSGFNFKIDHPKDKKRNAIISAQNAGAFLKAMDIYNSMEGGTLTIQGEFDDADPQRPFKGTLDITKNTITDAPILAKIVSLLSLTGFADTLTGNGISFNKTHSQIAFTKDYIHIKDGRTVGPALGITVENGLFNRNSGEISVNGTVVPSYTLNSLVGNIPLIGEVLSGGEGEGIFAATYKVEGTFPDKVDVSVNPLAMLAPGFLRNLFGSSKEVELPKPAAPVEETVKPEQTVQ